MELNLNPQKEKRTRSGKRQLRLILICFLGITTPLLILELGNPVTNAMLIIRLVISSIVLLTCIFSFKAVLHRSVVFVLLFIAAMQEFLRAGMATAEIRTTNYFWLASAFTLLGFAGYLLYSPEISLYYHVAARVRSMRKSKRLRTNALKGE